MEPLICPAAGPVMVCFIDRSASGFTPGGPPPARVVRARLISVSFFQGGEGRGEFGRIELADGDRVLSVL
jgi:hypothetical protein